MPGNYMSHGQHDQKSGFCNMTGSPPPKLTTVGGGHRILYIYFLGLPRAPGELSGGAQWLIWGGDPDILQNPDFWSFWPWLIYFPGTYDPHLWGICWAHGYYKTPRDGVRRSPGSISEKNFSCRGGAPGGPPPPGGGKFFQRYFQVTYEPYPWGFCSTHGYYKTTRG